MISEETAKDLYIQWLQGRSLRDLAPLACCSHPILRKYFIHYFGQGATDPVKTSLARSLLSDYPDDPEVLETALRMALETPESQRHRSNHNMKQLSRYQVVHEPEMLDYMVPQDYYDPYGAIEPEKPLRLIYVTLWLSWLLTYLRKVVDKGS